MYGKIDEIVQAIRFGLRCKGVAKMDERAAMQVAQYLDSNLQARAHPEMIKYDNLVIELYEFQVWAQGQTSSQYDHEYFVEDGLVT